MRALLARMRDVMECKRIQPLLQSYLDGELDPEQALRVSTHLDRRRGLRALHPRQPAC